MLLVTMGQDHVFHTSPGGGKVETWRRHLRRVVSEWPDQTTIATVLSEGASGEGTQATTASAAAGSKGGSQITPAGFFC